MEYLVFCPLDGGNIHVVGGGAHILILLVSKDVDTNQVHLQDNKELKKKLIKCTKPSTPNQPF